MSIPYTLYLKDFPEENIGSLPDLFKILWELNTDGRFSNEKIIEKRQNQLCKVSSGKKQQTYEISLWF